MVSSHIRVQKMRFPVQGLFFSDKCRDLLINSCSATVIDGVTGCAMVRDLNVDKDEAEDTETKETAAK